MARQLKKLPCKQSTREDFEFAIQEINFLLNFDDKDQDASNGKFTEM